MTATSIRRSPDAAPQMVTALLASLRASHTGTARALQTALRDLRAAEATYNTAVDGLAAAEAAYRSARTTALGLWSDEDLSATGAEPLKQGQRARRLPSPGKEPRP